MNYAIQFNILTVNHRFFGFYFSVLIVIRVVTIVLLGNGELFYSFVLIQIIIYNCERVFTLIFFYNRAKCVKITS